ncbi:unnamed protein product [Prorocentrum cordatum]|uniref:Uncharacterized protein n=1 Tax=Prorocentrum cordatum TaxID=2364126 RepID=A0ABN9XBD5_9DINO|nr:unnamed protein product [Polarella glacialis]
MAARPARVLGAAIPALLAVLLGGVGAEKAPVVVHRKVRHSALQVSRLGASGARHRHGRRQDRPGSSGDPALLQQLARESSAAAAEMTAEAQDQLGNIELAHQEAAGAQHNSKTEGDMLHTALLENNENLLVIQKLAETVSKMKVTDRRRRHCCRR